MAITLHFLAILTTLVGTGSYRFPAPALAARIRHTRAIEIYLQSTFLTSPYRFYAPDPGPTTLLWFKLYYPDGGVRWVEVAPAGRDRSPLRTSFQRQMSLPLLLDWTGLYPDPDDSRKVIFTEEGKACTSSFVRRVVRSNPQLGADRPPTPASWVAAYLVYHQILQPYQIRMGWQPDDLRLYNQTYLGVYSSTGSRIDDPEGSAGYVIPLNTYVFAEFLLQHVAPALSDVAARERPSRMDALHLPTPWQSVLGRYPDLLDQLGAPSADDAARPGPIERLQRRIEEKVMSQDRPLPGGASIQPTRKTGNP